MSEPLPEWVDARVNELLKEIAAQSALLEEVRTKGIIDCDERMKRHLERQDRLETEIEAKDTLLEEARKALEAYINVEQFETILKHGRGSAEAVRAEKMARNVLASLASSSPAGHPESPRAKP